MKIEGGLTQEETTKIILGPRTSNFYNYVASPSAEKLHVDFPGSAQPMTSGT
jgi:hypothetical protein